MCGYLRGPRAEVVGIRQNSCNRPGGQILGRTNASSKPDIYARYKRVSDLHGSRIAAHLSTLALFPQVAGSDDRFVVRFAFESRLALIDILDRLPIVVRVFARLPFGDRIQGRLSDARSVDRTPTGRGRGGESQVFGREDRIRIRFCTGDSLLGCHNARPQVLLQRATKGKGRRKRRQVMSACAIEMEEVRMENAFEGPGFRSRSRVVCCMFHHLCTHSLLFGGRVN